MSHVNWIFFSIFTVSKKASIMVLKANSYYKSGVLLLFVLICTGLNCFAFSKSDSLKNQLLFTSEDTVLLKLYTELIDVYANSNSDSAMIYADMGFDLAEDIDSPHYAAIFNMRLGNMFFRQGNYGRAVEYYYSTLKYYEENNQNTEGLVAPYFNIALVYDKLNNNKNAQEYYFKAVKIVEELLKIDPKKGSEFSIGRIYNNIGITYHNFKEYDKALDFYHKALSISVSIDNLEALPYAYNNIGQVYQETGDCEIALTFYEKALNFRIAENDLEGIAITYYYFGQCYAIMNENIKSIENYNKGYKIAKELGAIELQKNIAEALIEELAEVKNYKRAYEMHTVYKTLSDSLNFAESSRTAVMLEQQYRFDKIQKELELRQQQLIFRNITIGGILFTLLAVISLLFFLAQSKVRRIRLQRENLKLEKGKLEGELDYKNKELTTNVMYLLRKNELINSISLKLLDLKNLLLKSNQDPIQKIINELQRSLDSDVWKEFEYRFKDVHEDFYRALNQRYPELTHNERKLCAFLRLNMSTKEISAITFQTPHSITIARSRLRKKLDISNKDINLVDFLAAIE